MTSSQRRITKDSLAVSEHFFYSEFSGIFAQYTDVLAQGIGGRVIVIMQPGFNSPRRLNRIAYTYMYMCMYMYIRMYMYRCIYIYIYTSIYI